MSSFKYLSTLFLIISIIQLASNARLKGYRQSIGNMTRDQEFLINTSPKFYCTLHENRTSRNCSDMLVMFKNAKLESTCINSTTLEFSIKNATAANSGAYHCYLHPRLFIRAATYNFGTKPQNVTNFKCISKGFQNLTCTWKPVPNKVKTTYIIGANFKIPITMYVKFFSTRKFYIKLKIKNSSTAIAILASLYNRYLFSLSTFSKGLRGKGVRYFLTLGFSTFLNYNPTFNLA